MEIWAPVAGGAIGLICLLLAIASGRRKRLIDNIPTSKTSGVFIGLVELQGTAETESPLRSYIGETSCVLYRWSIEEHWSRLVTETYTDANGKTSTRTRTESGWTTVASGGEQIPFYLRDDCGAVLVRPKGATIHPATLFSATCGPGDPLYYGKGPGRAIANSTHTRSFTEYGIPLHSPVYVMGHARERKDAVAPEIAQHRDAEMFLISTRPEAQIARGYLWKFWLAGIFGLLAASAGSWFGSRGDVQATLVGAGIYAGAGFVAWIVMLYNCMISLKKRVDQAWSNLDVQFKRRSDLIPSLLATVKGMRDYEQQTQQLAAALRSRLDARRAGEDANGAAPLTPALIALGEAYPAIAADANFRKLQDALIDTEQRIALASSYYNDIVTFYNNRIEIIPDRFIASLARMKKRDLLSPAVR